MNRADLPATRISQASAMLMPAPAATPLIMPMITLGCFRIAIGIELENWIPRARAS